jgi:hypothetical protein
MSLNIITHLDEIKISNNQTQMMYFYTDEMPLHSKYLTMLGDKSISNIAINAIDVAAFPTQIKRFKIECVPTILLFRDGREHTRLTSYQQTRTNAVKEALDNISIGVK